MWVERTRRTQVGGLWRRASTTGHGHGERPCRRRQLIERTQRGDDRNRTGVNGFAGL